MEDQKLCIVCNKPVKSPQGKYCSADCLVMNWPLPSTIPSKPKAHLEKVMPMKLSDLQKHSPIFDTAPNPNAILDPTLDPYTGEDSEETIYLQKVIYRKQGIEDGSVISFEHNFYYKPVLIESGLTLPTSMEWKAYVDYVSLNAAASKLLQTSQSEVTSAASKSFTQKRFRNILQMFRLQASKRTSDDEIVFSFYAVTDSVKAKQCQLKAVVGVEAEQPWLCFVNPDTKLMP
jgi:hypothetical protein